MLTVFGASAVSFMMDARRAQALPAGRALLRREPLTLPAVAALIMEMMVCLFDTALGTCGVRWGERGIVEVLMPPARVERAAACIGLDEAPEPVRGAIGGIVALLDGERRELRTIELDEGALDEFDRRVYAATRCVGPGETTSYGEIARAIGEPDEARAVGAALGRNPFPIIVPCHRVLSASGALHGFSAPGGLRTKRRMLEIEGAPGFGQQALFA